MIADQDARAAALKRQARQAERYRLLSDQIWVAEARMIFPRWREAHSQWREQPPQGPPARLRHRRFIGCARRVCAGHSDNVVSMDAVRLLETCRTALMQHTGNVAQLRQIHGAD